MFEKVVIISGRSVNEDGKARLLLLACIAPKTDITVQALLPEIWPNDVDCEILDGSSHSVTPG